MIYYKIEHKIIIVKHTYLQMHHQGDIDKFVKQLYYHGF